MPLPLSYNLKNLTVRRTTTLMTRLGHWPYGGGSAGDPGPGRRFGTGPPVHRASASSAGIEEELPLGAGQPDQPRGRVEHPKQTGDSATGRPADGLSGSGDGHQSAAPQQSRGGQRDHPGPVSHGDPNAARPEVDRGPLVPAGSAGGGGREVDCQAVRPDRRGRSTALRPGRLAGGGCF